MPLSPQPLEAGHREYYHGSKCGYGCVCVEPARHDAQKSRGRDGDGEDEDEDDSVGRLTSEEAWLFPVVRSFIFFVLAGES